jgi:hypothetical protein
MMSCVYSPLVTPPEQHCIIIIVYICSDFTPFHFEYLCLFWQMYFVGLYVSRCVHFQLQQLLSENAPCVVSV